MNKIISIRSYKRRQGRMLPSRQRALDELWENYGISLEEELDPITLFGRKAPCQLEIGFGMGDALLEMARTHPENNYLGVEVYLPGIGQLLLGIKKLGLTNIRIDRREAADVLNLLPKDSLEQIYLFFPDPWPKKRHHKRRLVQPVFAEKLRRVLIPGGRFHVATDWEPYAHQICEVMEADPGFINWSGDGKLYRGPVKRPLTKFEKRGLKKGLQVRELLFERTARNDNDHNQLKILEINHENRPGQSLQSCIETGNQG